MTQHEGNAFIMHCTRRMPRTAAGMS